MKERSHSELMKSGAKKRNQDKGSTMLDIYIDMLLLEALLNHEKEKLTKKIDQAIDERDEQAFLLLSKQFIDLNRRFGT